MPDALMPAEIATSPVGEAMCFMIDKLRQTAPFTPDELAARFASDWVQVARDRLTQYRQLFGTFIVTGYRAPSANVGVVELVDEKGRAQAFGVALGDGRIRSMADGARPPGFAWRRAVPADAAALAALELTTPLVTGDVETVYDRSADYFEAERLMGGGETLVVERGGAVVGISASVVNPIRVAGRSLLGIYLHRLRVHPSVQGSGVNRLLNLATFEVSAGGPGDRMRYGFIAADNTAQLNALISRGQRSPWKEGCERLVIDTGGAASAGFGRRAQEADAERLVELLNDTHGEEELFVPYSPASLHERLEREQASYSWSNFLISERACIGVWAPHTGVIRRVGGVETRTVRGFVLDYGCEKGGVGELIALVNEWRARLAAAGTTEVTIFTSAGSRANAELAALAKRREPYVIQCVIPPGDRLEERGVYVDQLYF